MKKNIFLIINKKNNIINFSDNTENFIADLLEYKEEFDNNITIYNINFIYNYLLNIFIKYKFYLMFLIIFIIILKKITLYFSIY